MKIQGGAKKTPSQINGQIMTQGNQNDLEIGQYVLSVLRSCAITVSWQYHVIPFNTAMFSQAQAFLTSHLLPSAVFIQMSRELNLLINNQASDDS